MTLIEERIAADDRIHEDAEAEFERATAIMLRRLGGSVWSRCSGEVIELED